MTRAVSATFQSDTLARQRNSYPFAIVGFVRIREVSGLVDGRQQSSEGDDERRPEVGVGTIRHARD